MIFTFSHKGRIMVNMWDIWKMYLIIIKMMLWMQISFDSLRLHLRVSVCTLTYLTMSSTTETELWNPSVLLPLTSCAGQSPGNSAFSGLPFTVKKMIFVAMSWVQSYWRVHCWSVLLPYFTVMKTPPPCFYSLHLLFCSSFISLNFHCYIIRSRSHSLNVSSGSVLNVYLFFLY